MSSWWWPRDEEDDDDDGWDLHAVVRSCRRTNSLAVVPPPPPWESVIFQTADVLLPSHHADLINTSSSVQELEELCRPFISPAQEPKFNLPPATVAPLSQLPRSRRRKNQQKRRVCQVLADGLSGDLWSWRKYGQKPIKGSPFPRGYYRCSSSKGCLARKQVERSRTDQGMFVITYTGEHNHPLPTQRNSLAGSTRQKFQAGGTEVGGGIPPEPSTSAGEGGVRLSPNTPLTAGMEEELLRPRKKKKQEVRTEDEGELEEEDEDLDMLLVEDMEVVGDDEVLFTGFEELQSSSSLAVDGIFGWDGESRRTGTLLWRPAGDG